MNEMNIICRNKHLCIFWEYIASLYIPYTLLMETQLIDQAKEFVKTGNEGELIKLIHSMKNSVLLDELSKAKVSKLCMYNHSILSLYLFMHSETAIGCTCEYSKHTSTTTEPSKGFDSMDCVRR